MKRLMACALFVLATSGMLTGATFAALNKFGQPTGPRGLESYVFSTSSPEMISLIRERIANNETITPVVRIAPGADGINRNHLASGIPFWSWHVAELEGLWSPEFTSPAVFYPEPPLSELEADVEGFIANNGDVIRIRFLSRIVEIDPEDPGHLFNVSSRGVLGSGDRVLITGFIVQGTTPRLVLVRALGPKLVDYDITGAAENPALILFRGQTAIAGSSDWETSPGRELIPPGLEPLDPKDAAIVVILEPGAYTVHASSPDEGIGLVDVFDLTAMR
ncbi:MAG TPA: hypothetical protein VMM36_15205 [Opitutaceae bacterium]|nr:hypothetical protein [Opitutaceae bacterium]